VKLDSSGPYEDAFEKENGQWQSKTVALRL